MQRKAAILWTLLLLLVQSAPAGAQVVPLDQPGTLNPGLAGPKRVFSPKVAGENSAEENREAAPMNAIQPPPGPGGGLPMAPGAPMVPGGAGFMPTPGAGMAPPPPAIPAAPAAADKDAIKVTGNQDDIERKPSGVTDIPCQPMDLNEQVSLDFKEVPLDDLIRLMSCWTSKNFMLQGGFQGKTITLMSPNPVTVAQAYRAFLSVLRVHGLVIVPAGAYLKIVPDAQAKQEPIPIIKKAGGLPEGDEMVTKMVPLQHVPASELTQVLDKFKGKAGEIIAYGEDQLIITDHAVMIERLLGLIKELDMPTDKEKIWVRQVEYAEAGELLNVVTGLFGDTAGGKKLPGAPAANPAARQIKGRPVPGMAQRPGGTDATVVGTEGEVIGVSKALSDERTNQIILVCNRTTYLRVDKLLRKLDVPIPGEGQIHIIYLENADAEEISSTLSSLTSGAKAATSGGPRKVGGGPAAAVGASGAALFEGEVKITADKGTNALVVEASLKDFMSLRKVVDLLDIRRKQVYVEAIIMEIISTKDRNYGASSSAGTSFNIDGNEVPLMVGMGGLGMSGLDTTQLTQGGMAVGMQGPLLDVSTGDTGTSTSGSLSVPAYGFMLQAIASNSDVNILSTPHILTTDNEEAEIQVGKQIPYQSTSMGGLSSLMGLGGMSGLSGYGTNTSTYGSSGYSGMGGLGGYSSLLSGMGGMGQVQRIDVDLTLKITPHVNESNFVKLEIDQSIEDVESIDRNLGPTTSKRKVKNVVVVKDQQPVVIGGLIRDTESEGVNKVPILGDIPLIGMLFRNTITATEKKNLLMVIIPHIIEDPSDLTRIHRERSEEIRRFAEYLATKEKEKHGIVDYQKKKGGLESMNQVVNRTKAEREERERARFEGTSLDIVGPPETHELDYDPSADKDSQEGQQ
jgi:general secretion pathway protein D